MDKKRKLPSLPSLGKKEDYRVAENQARPAPQMPQENKHRQGKRQVEGAPKKHPDKMPVREPQMKRPKDQKNPKPFQMPNILVNNTTAEEDREKEIQRKHMENAQEHTNTEMEKHFIAPDSARKRRERDISTSRMSSENLGRPLTREEQIRKNQHDNTMRLLDEKFKEIDSQNIGAFAISYIPTDAILNAPADFFNPYVDVVARMVTHIQDRLAVSDSAMLMANVRANPMNEEYKGAALDAIDRETINYENTTRDYTFISLDRLEKRIVKALVANEIIGLGPLEPLLYDSRIREIMCNGPYDIQVEIGGYPRKVPSLKFRDKEHLRNLINRLFTSVNKEVSRMNPKERARLFDNSRVFAVDDSVAPEGPSLNIRRHTEDWIEPDRYLTWNSADQPMLEWLGNHVYHGLSMVVSGGTATGKALSVDTPIPTPNGMVRMGDIKPGDIVFDKNANKTEVVGVFPQGKKDNYKITLENSIPTDSDKDHNWLVREPQAKDEEIMTSGEIQNLLKDGRRVYIPVVSEPVIYNTSYSPKLDPFLLGIYLTCGVKGKAELEGERRHLMSIRTALSNKKVGYFLDEPYYKNSSLSGTYITPSDVFLKNLKEDLEALSEKKYMTVSLDDRSRFLEGLLFNKTRNSFTKHVTIENLPKEHLGSVMTVIASMGLKIVKTNDTALEIARTSKNTYCEELLPFVDEKIKAGGSTELYKDDYYKIESAVVDGSAEMQCIAVDSDSSTFLFGDLHGVTHNTTLLAALTGYFPNNKRIISIERNIEMKMCPGKLLAPPMEVVPAKASSSFAGVSMLDLVEASTQMRPDIIVLGEITGPEAYEFLNAANSGHQVFTTVHANDCDACINRFVTLASLTGLITGKAVLDLIAEAVDVVIQIRRFAKDGSRKIVEVAEVDEETSLNAAGEIVLRTKPIWQFVEDENSALHSEVKGKWVKVGELSENRVTKHSLDTVRYLSWEELQDLYSEAHVK